MAGRHPEDQNGLDTLLQGWFPAVVNQKPTQFVVVCDIGQGNCNIVFDTEGKPILYYDFGGGFGKSAHTYASPEPTFCCLADTKYILSHWDSDHNLTMNLKLKGTTMNNTHWLVPNQESYDPKIDDVSTMKWKGKIMRGPEGDGLLTDLAKVADVHLWPDEEPGTCTILRSKSSYYRVIKVTGTNRNNHALALRITNPSVAGEYFLLTGDATYQPNTFNHKCNRACVGLVASHHGSEVKDWGSIPRPKANSPYLIAYSFGWGNEYGHPHQKQGVPAYESRGWDDDHRMDTGGAEGAARYAGPRGNVGLIWPADPKGPGVVPTGGGAPEINKTAVALIASAAAEIDTVKAGLAQKDKIAVAAACRAAVEVGSQSAANAMQTPAVQIPAKTLAQVATDMAGTGTVHASLTAALQAAPGNAGAAAAAMNANVAGLAKAIVEGVMIAAGYADKYIRYWMVKEVTDWVRQFKADVKNKNKEPTLPDQAKYAMDQACFTASTEEANEEIRGAIPDSFAQAIIAFATNLSNSNLPTVKEVKKDLTAAVLNVIMDAIGSRPQNKLMARQLMPPETTKEACNALKTKRDDLKAGISAAAALIPVVPVDPKTSAPNFVTNNENPKIAARTAAVAAIVGQRGGAAAADAALAAVAAARVVVAAAFGAPQVGCHRHPRTCSAGPCTLSIHFCLGMFQASMRSVNTALNDPRGMAYDSAWNLYVADAGAHCIYKIDAAGTRTVFAGVENTAGDGPDNRAASATSLRGPRDVAYHATRNSLIVADTENHRVREINLDTTATHCVAGDGNAGYLDASPATAGTLRSPSGVAVDVEDKVVIADTGNHCIRRLALEDDDLATIAGDGNTANFNSPLSVTVDDLTGDVYVADTLNHRIVRLEVDTNTPSVLAGDAGQSDNTGDGGEAKDARLDTPCYVKADAVGNLYVADAAKNRIRRIKVYMDKPPISAFAGKTNGTAGNSADGSLLEAVELTSPRGLHVDSGGRNLFVSDAGNNRVLRIRC